MLIPWRVFFGFLKMMDVFSFCLMVAWGCFFLVPEDDGCFLRSAFRVEVDESGMRLSNQLPTGKLKNSHLPSLP